MDRGAGGCHSGIGAGVSDVLIDWASAWAASPETCERRDAAKAAKLLKLSL